MFALSALRAREVEYILYISSLYPIYAITHITIVMLIGYLLPAPNAEHAPNRATLLTNLPVLAYLENRDNVPWFDEQEHDTTGSGSPLGALTTLAYSVGIYKLYLR